MLTLKIHKIPRNLFELHFHTQIHAYLPTRNVWTPGPIVILTSYWLLFHLWAKGASMIKRDYKDERTDLTRDIAYTFYSLQVP